MPLIPSPALSRCLYKPTFITLGSGRRRLSKLSSPVPNCSRQTTLAGTSRAGSVWGRRQGSAALPASTGVSLSPVPDQEEATQGPGCGSELTTRRQKKWKTGAGEGRRRVEERRGNSPSLHPPRRAGPAAMALPTSPPPDGAQQKAFKSLSSCSSFAKTLGISMGL